MPVLRFLHTDDARATYMAGWLTCSNAYLRTTRNEYGMSSPPPYRGTRGEIEVLAGNERTGRREGQQGKKERKEGSKKNKATNYIKNH